MKAAYLTMNYETSVTFYNKLTALPEIGQNPEYLCMAANELANNAGELGKLNEATAIMKDAVEKTKPMVTGCLNGFNNFSEIKKYSNAFLKSGDDFSE